MTDVTKDIREAEISKLKLLTILVPVWNEIENVRPMYEELRHSLEELSLNWEILFVDDGSTDGTYEVLRDLHAENSRVKIIKFRRNLGKSAVLRVGFSFAQGDVIVTMDADLQDDPREISKVISPLMRGYDLVTGWKFQGKRPVSKLVPSKIFNFIVSRLTDTKLHDINCPFKAYWRKVARDIDVYGELHRYIPIIAINKGYKVTEVLVGNRPRLHGSSKYNWKRIFKGYIDLITVLFLTNFKHNPLYLFGIIGSFLFLVGFSIDFFLTVRGLFFTGVIGHYALLMFGVLMMMLGMHLIATGLVCELLVSQQSHDLQDYPIEEMLGLGNRKVSTDS